MECYNISGVNTKIFLCEPNSNCIYTSINICEHSTQADYTCRADRKSIHAYYTDRVYRQTRHADYTDRVYMQGIWKRCSVADAGCILWGRKSWVKWRKVWGKREAKWSHMWESWCSTAYDPLYKMRRDGTCTPSSAPQLVWEQEQLNSWHI